MGYKANIDIALSFSTLKICSVRQQGRIKFRICLYYITNTEQGKKVIEEIQFCHPYSILRKNAESKNINQSMKNIEGMRSHNSQKFKPMYQPFNFPIEESELDLSSDYYISKPFKMMFERENHPIYETCCFSTYIDTEKYSDINLKCQVELMFCPNAVSEDAAVFKTIGKCQCKIRKVFDVSTYLPIVFDEFEGVVIEGIYQAALIDFRYEKQQKQMHRSLNPQNFHDYLKNITNGFNRSQTRSFYKYYRQLLQKQLFTIQERHYDLLRILGIGSSSNLEEFRILKVNPNSKIQAMIDHLGGYNSHQNLYNYSNQRLYQISSSQSLSTNNDEVAYINRGIIVRGEYNNFNRAPKSSDRYKQQLSEEIIYDFLTIKAHIFKKWSDFLQFTTKNIILIAQKYRSNYNSLVKQRLSGNVFSHKVNAVDWKKSAYDDGGAEHLKLAQTDRMKNQKDQELWKEAFIVENEAFFVKDSKNIKIFQEIYEVNHSKIQNAKSQKVLLRKSLQRNNNFINPFILHSKLKKSYGNEQQNSINYGANGRKHSSPMSINGLKMEEQVQGIQLMISTVTNQNEEQDHFIILVHGFQASRQDFIVLKNCLEIRFKTKVFISTCNEGRTDDDIQIQGKRLAQELQRYLNESSPTKNYKLSFIGHSMGGVIIRTALFYLENNVDKHLYSYVSFSAPHLGYIYEPSTHIQAGLWFMNTWHKATSIQQISLRDKEDLRQSFLYRLSRSKTLDKFKQISLVGSTQDKYVPYQSARIQLNQHVIQQYLSAKNGQIIYEMIEGLLGTIQCKQLSRMDVIFNIQQSNFDSMIGRTAHIKYLSDRQFIKVFCIVFDKFFK